MGILSRLVRLISGKANSAMDKLEGQNIEVVTEQTLRDYEENIREVIAFPKTGDARDLLMGAPSDIEQKRLDEAHISIKKK